MRDSSIRTDFFADPLFRQIDVPFSPSVRNCLCTCVTAKIVTTQVNLPRPQNVASGWSLVPPLPPWARPVYEGCAVFVRILVTFLYLLGGGYRTLSYNLARRPCLRSVFG